MRCEDFKKYLLEQEMLYAETVQGEAYAHAENCHPCEELLLADDKLESAIKGEFGKVAVPERLFSRIEQDIQALENRGKKSFMMQWKAALPALAMAALVFFMLIPLTGNIKSPEKLGQLAVSNHMGNMSMMFSAGEVADVPSWFVGRLDFPVRMPNLEGEGYQLAGGRKCSLGREDVAYLFYDRGGERASLFMLEPGKIDFEVKKEKDYHLKIKNMDVKIWRENSLIYTLVNNRDISEWH